VRGGLTLSLQSVEQLGFGEFTLSLPTPCASYTFEIENSGGQQGVIDFGSEFAFFLVDRLFGGNSSPVLPNRALTPLERMAIRMIAERITGLVSEVWQDYFELKLNLTGFESIPEILRVANREDPVLVANLEVACGDMRSLLLVCLPFAVLEKFFAGSSERRVTVLGSPDEIAHTRAVAEQSLLGTRLLVSACLPEFRMSMRELLGLSAGTVLATGLPRTSELDVFVGEQRRFRATPGRIGASLAVQVTEGLLAKPDTDTLPLSRY
jgi:flagellar motor switch protein FliM